MKKNLTKYKGKGWFELSKTLLMAFGGSLIYGIGVGFFIKQQNLLTGGFAGIALLISSYFPHTLDAGIWTIILNIPLIIAGLIVFGKKYMFMTVYGTVVSSLCLSLFEFIAKTIDPAIGEVVDGEIHRFLTNNTLMAGIIGGALAGVGRAIIFRSGSNTGGTDILVKFIRIKHPNFTAGNLFLIFDGVLIITHAILQKSFELALYTAVTLVISNFLFDKIMFGFDSAKVFYIVSNKKEQLTERIIKEVNAGVTVLDASGGYTHEHKDILMVAIKKHYYPKLKKVVKEEDPKAFFIVTQATEIYGLGFKENDEKKQA